ncbi:helicase/Zfx/Zfy transcription activation region domain-containing protein [Escherichia coli]|uniref:TraI domain-containing protein n=1 Tax=Escherichia coli TaxID=562 RepID=UPI0017E1DA18|nr:TraI domain-containing protein [Escherichia coli]EFC9510232.1 heavy metal resistance protein CzcA [Escherichia coli]CAD5880864.1 helicase/Zfx/Zfy transcription activation region domain-containing protein [Escherichia coli]
MLNRLKKLLPGSGNTSSIETTAPEAAHQSERLPEGFYMPRSAEELMSTLYRKQCLKQLWENSSMPSGVYQQFCLTPVQKLLMAAQNVPAARDSRWADANGFGDLTLQFTTYAVRLARGYMFPPGATPEEQAAQSGVWNAVVFWSALFYHLPLLAHLEGELVSGKLWQPGMSSPDEAFRFRYRQQRLQGSEAQQLAAVMAGQLLPEGATAWLATVPGALQNLAGGVWHQHPEMALIRSVLKTAAEEVESPLLALPVTEAVAAPLLSENTVQSEDNVPSDSQSETSTEASAPETQAVATEEEVFTLQPSVSGADEAEAVVRDTLQSATGVEAKAPEVQSVHDDTGMLLSLFSVTDDHTAVAAADGECLQETQVLIDNDHSQRKHEDTAITLISGNSVPEAVISEGEMFINWLKKGVRNGEISLNRKKDKIHIVAGFVFLPVPGIFYEFTKAAGIPADKKDDIQASFERLNIHKRRDNRRFYFAHLCEEPENRSRFKTLKGYLVKGRQLLDGQELQDSRYLFFP